MRALREVIGRVFGRKSNLDDRRKCWRDSTKTETVWQPLARSEAGRRWHKLRRLDMRTHEKGKHGGAIGRVGLVVYHTLAFECLHYKTGQLDPALETIARKASCSRRAVVDALDRLQHFGVIERQRRCEIVQGRSGQYELHQRTNAYRLPAPALWKTGERPDDPPAPEAGTWGDHPPGPEELDMAAERAAAGDTEGAIRDLDLAPAGSLERALSDLGKALLRSAAEAKHPRPG